MSYIIGIDIGTYESKGILVHRDGTVLESESISHKLEIPQPGWAEHDAEKTWWNDTTYLAQKLLSKGKINHRINPGDIKVIGLSTIAPAVVPIDSDGKPLRKAILYGVDVRANREIEELNRSIGKENILKNSGHYLSSQSAGPKILWIKRNEPEVYRQTYKFLSGTGYIVYKLTGKYFIDYYTAAAFSPLLDINRLAWNEEYVQLVTDLNCLPQLAWSYEVVGEVTEEAARETGLNAGTKVINGTADALSESISVGAVKKGDLMLMYGSSTFFIQVVDKLLSSDKFWPSVHVVPDLYTVTGGTSTAGSITRWFIDQWLTKDYKELDEAYTYLTKLATQESEPGSRGLITLPYFSGERTPIHDPNARGVFFGLTLKNSIGDIYRSILEGIGYSIRDNLEEMKRKGVVANRVVAIGGGIKNEVWLQSVSNICRIKQLLPKIRYGASYGDAFLAALGMEWYSRLDEIDKWIDYINAIDPEYHISNIYDDYYKVYKRLYKQTKEEMYQMSQLEANNHFEER